VRCTGSRPKGEIKTSFNAEPLKCLPSAGPNSIAALPSPSEWVNLQTLGAKGDGTTDDTATIRKAIAEHRVLYVPSGRYIVTDTITLRPDTVLIGLHPHETQFDIPDSTPGFQGPGAPKALLEAPQGGTNIVSGIGLYTGGINSRAVGALWMAGKDSLMDDVRFFRRARITYDSLQQHAYSRPGPPQTLGRTVCQFVGDERRRRNIREYLDARYLCAGWVYVSNTTTPGYVYELSAEHHVRTEMKFSQVSNWGTVCVADRRRSGGERVCAVARN
jgi:hypothetical protein